MLYVIYIRFEHCASDKSSEISFFRYVYLSSVGLRDLGTEPILGLTNVAFERATLLVEYLSS
jgi:hypothetical protein